MGQRAVEWSGDLLPNCVIRAQSPRRSTVGCKRGLFYAYATCTESEAVAGRAWCLKSLLRLDRTVSYFLLRTSSTTCRTAVTMESGDSAMSWCASTITCRPRVDKRTRLACNWCTQIS